MAWIDPEELDAFLVLNASGLSPMRQKSLMDAFGSARAILAARDQDYAEIDGLRASHIARLREATASLDPAQMRARCEELGITPTPCTSPDYPPLLAEIADAPSLLFVEGSFERRDDLSIGLVGTRRCSAYGLAMARRLAEDLARRGFTIVSGMALGVDAEAHEAALEAGGRTIAVMASGPDITYPRQHRGMRANIAGCGAVVTEFALGTEPIRERFPARNRIISGLSLGVVVIEAPEKSGALITARLAAEQGREVFAVPGDVTRPESRGCHALIKDGAQLVEFAEDVVAGLGILLAAVPERTPVPTADLPGDEKSILDALSHEPRHVDDVVTRCGLQASQVSAGLMMLEMKGFARRLPGSTFVRM